MSYYTALLQAWRQEQFYLSPSLLEEKAGEISRKIETEPPMPVEADSLKNLVDQRQPFIFSTARRAYNAAKEHLQKVLERHVDFAHVLAPEKIIESLEYLAKAKDIYRFSVYYAAFFQGKVERDLTATMSQLSHEIPDSRWLRRVVEEPNWICGLVPVRQLQPFVRNLDLRNCEPYAIEAVMKVHSAFTELIIDLNCTQDDFVTLKRAFQHVRVINFKDCPAPYDWNVIEPHLAHIPTLQNISVPSHLLHPTLTQGLWRKEIEQTIEQRLQELAHTNAESRARNARFMKISADNTVAHYLGNFCLLLGQDPFNYQAWQVLTGQGMLSATCERLRSTFKHKPNALEKYILSYCPNITAKDFSELYQPTKHFELMGCINVTDGCFTHHWLMTKPDSYTGIVDLRCTKVSPEMLAILKAKQPRATFHHDDGAFYKGDFTDGDSQGLSPEALQVMLHIKKYGYLPPLLQIEGDPLRICKELISFQGQFFQDSTIEQNLKTNCRYFLQVNVNPENVFELLQFAIIHEDGALLDVCRSLIFIFNLSEPLIPEICSRLPTEKTDPTSKTYTPKDICFAACSAPLAELIERDDYRGFLARLRKVDIATAQDMLSRMRARFANCYWLQFLSENLPRIHASEPIRDIVRLECDQAHFVKMTEGGLFDTCCFLDLRGCTGISYRVIEPHLLKLKGLYNVLFPQDLQDIETVSSQWSYTMAIILWLNLFRSLKSEDYYKGGVVPSLTYAVIRNRSFQTDWETFHPPLMNVLLSSPKDRTRCTFGPFVDFSRLEIVSEALFRSLQFSTKPLTLDLAYCPNITPACLSYIFNTLNVAKLSLYGCSYINENYFTELGHFQGSLDLRYTSVSADFVQQLKKKLKVRFDCTPQQADMSHFSHPTLSKEALAAIFTFKLLRVWPLITNAVAIELLTVEYNLLNDKGKKSLTYYCQSHLKCNITSSNCLELYRLGQKLTDQELCFLSRLYVELFHNAFYSESETSAELRQIQIDPPGLYPEHLAKLYYKQPENVDSLTITMEALSLEAAPVAFHDEL